MAQVISPRPRESLRLSLLLNLGLLLLALAMIGGEWLLHTATSRRFLLGGVLGALIARILIP